MKQNYFFLIAFFIITACGGQENKTINTNEQKTKNRLLIPPCLYPTQDAVDNK